MSGFQPVPDCIRCVIYARISKDALGDGHANQLADLEKRSTARGWTVTCRLSDNDIGVTRKDATAAGKRRRGMRRCCGWWRGGGVEAECLLEHLPGADIPVRKLIGSDGQPRPPERGLVHHQAHTGGQDRSVQSEAH